MSTPRRSSSRGRLHGAGGVGRHGGHLLLFAWLAALAALALAWPSWLPASGRIAWTIVGLTVAAFATGWLCRGRHDALGGWLAAGAAGAVWLIGLASAGSVEVERWLVRNAHEEVMASIDGAEGTSALFRAELERAMEAERGFDARAEVAWARVLPLGLALLPVALGGTCGAVLGSNRRRKRRGDATAPAPVADAPSRPMGRPPTATPSVTLAREIRLRPPAS